MSNKTVEELSDVIDKAACKDKPHGMFFVDEGPLSDKTVRAAIALAVATCNTCPIQINCLMHAVNNNEEFLIWGGFTSKERKKLFGKNSSITEEEAFEAVRWKKNTK